MKTFVQCKQICRLLMVGISMMGSCLHAEVIQQGLDTGLYGNWVKKHEWQRLSEKLLVEMDTVYADLEKYDVEKFQPKYAEIDQKFNDFYKKIGVSKSSVGALLQEVKEDLVEKLQKSLQADDDINDQRIDSEQKAFQLDRDIKKAEFDIKQIEVDMQLVERFDQEINARQSYVQEILTMGQNKRTEGIQVFEELKLMLDDRKAREKYYFIKGSVDHLIELSAFYLNTFLVETNDIIQKSVQHMQQIEASIRQLEEKGAVINNRSVVLQELKIKEAEEKLRALEREEEERLAREKNRPVPISRPLSLFERSSKFVFLIWYVITDIAVETRNSVYSFLFGRPYNVVKKRAKKETDIVEKKSNLEKLEVIQQQSQAQDIATESTTQNLIP
ncbi:hypothetical protein JKY79_00450 [Candidatus Babeliales bacterium]|nr:hypothetical protein [Candidatus Babeliales bacterium]